MTMRNLVCGAAVWFASCILGGTALAAGTQPYLWTISSSPVDPWANVGAPSAAPSTLFLWYVGPENTTGACFGFQVTGSTLLGVNTGGIVVWTDDCFSFPCLGGPVVVAGLMFAPSPGGLDVCLAPHYITGTICNFDCGATPTAFESSYVGFSSTGSVPCSHGGGPACGTVSTDRVSWGRTKAGYR